MSFRVITQQIFECLYDLLAARGIQSPDLDQQRRLRVDDDSTSRESGTLTRAGSGNLAH